MTVSPASLERNFATAGLERVGSSIRGPQQINRRCKVVFEEARSSAITLTNGKSTADTVDRTVFIANESRNDFRVKFKFARDIWGVPQPCSVEIYGLAQETRRLIQKTKFMRVSVIVGYDPPQLDLARSLTPGAATSTTAGGAFGGAVGGGALGTSPPRDADAFLKLVGVLSSKQVNPRHDGAEWITKFEGADGGRAYWGSRVNKSWAAGTPKAQIVGEMLKGAGKVGPQALATLQSKAGSAAWKNGRTFAGRIAPTLAWLLRDVGLQHCVVNEEVILLPIDGTTKEVYDLGADSGLIGTVEYAGQPVEGKPQLLKAKALLGLADLRPGALILLDSDAHKGQFRCRSMEHRGDTEGGDWYVETELQGLAGIPDTDSIVGTISSRISAAGGA